VRGAQGTKEKDLALAVARRVKGVIEGRLGIRVLLTRDDDRNIPLDDRTALANNNKADLFISLHANASVRRSAAGATVFPRRLRRQRHRSRQSRRPANESRHSAAVSATSSSCPGIWRKRGT
jgi:N-acetylmuramoyl-L-alanine amidase